VTEEEFTALVADVLRQNGGMSPDLAEELAYEIWEALPGEKEPEDRTLEWEYAWMGDELSQTQYWSYAEASEYMGNPRLFRRRKAGPWEEVR
jgi:hypothetical protein